MMNAALLEMVKKGDVKAIARSISLIENETEGYEAFLQQLPPSSTRITGITGPPGAGKSTLVDGLVGELVASGKAVAVLCVDPSSPFNLGALLGDRIRMSRWYNHPGVYIRSLATRGSLGGLHPRIIEISDLVRAAPFDHVIIETVGVGQSEIEIAGLADTTIVVVVPEAGDEIQTMKAGVMEIADIFVVNKSDRPGADLFIRNLGLMLAPSFTQHAQHIPVIKMIASQQSGIAELIEAIRIQQTTLHASDRKFWLLAERAYHILRNRRMKDISKHDLRKNIIQQYTEQFNLYRFVQAFE